MTPIRFKRESEYSVSVLDDTEDGNNRGGFSGPKEVIQGIMDMQEEARLHREAGIKKAASVKGTGTDRGAAAAVLQSVDTAAPGTTTVNLESWDDTVAVLTAARKVFEKLDGVVGFPELKALGFAIRRAGRWALGAPEVESKALDRVNEELAAEGGPEPGPENSVSIEELPYPELIMLLQSDQITTKRYIEEMDRREKVWVEQMLADAETYKAAGRRFFLFRL